MKNIYDNLRKFYQDYSLTNFPANKVLTADEFTSACNTWSTELKKTRSDYIADLSNSPLVNYSIKTENIQLLNLIELMGELWQDISPHHFLSFRSIPEEQTYLTLNLHFYNTLEDLLNYYEDFIDCNQSKGICRDRIYTIISQRYVAENLSLIESQLENFVGDENIKRIILSAFTKFSNSTYPKSSNFDFIHLKRLLREICFKSIGTETESNLYSWCIYHNFNTQEFYEYAIENFLQDIYLSDSPGANLQKAKSLLTSLKQQNMIINRILVPIHLPIDSLLSKWLKQEISNIKIKMDIDIQNPSKSDELSNYTINTKLSVGQLSVLTEAFIESNIIQTKNKSLHNRFLAKHFLTTRGKDFSPISLRTNQKDVSSKHLEDLVQKLKNCIDYVENFHNS
jgi:hypothetical protein